MVTPFYAGYKFIGPTHSADSDRRASMEPSSHELHCLAKYITLFFNSYFHCAKGEGGWVGGSILNQNIPPPSGWVGGYSNLVFKGLKDQKNTYIILLKLIMNIPHCCSIQTVLSQNSSMGYLPQFLNISLQKSISIHNLLHFFYKLSN